MLRIILCLALGLLAPPLAAAESRLTSIANADCRFAPVGNEPGNAEDQLKSCPGLGGAQVLVNASHARLRIGFRWRGPGRRVTERWVAEAWSAGERITGAATVAPAASFLTRRRSASSPPIPRATPDRSFSP